MLGYKEVPFNISTTLRMASHASFQGMRDLPFMQDSGIELTAVVCLDGARARSLNE